MSKKLLNIPLLRKMCGRLNATSTRNTHHTTSKPNQKYDEENKAIPRLCSDHPYVIMTYHASDMVLAGHSNASYLSESNAQSRARTHFFMSNNVETPPNNGAVFTISQIIKAVLSLAAKAKVGALYINCREAVPAQRS